MLEKEATISTRFQKAPRHAIHSLQRRINPGRMYQQNNDRISYEELLAFDQNIDQLRAFTERDVKWREIKDFTGKVIDPEKTGNGWYYIVPRAVWRRWKEKKFRWSRWTAIPKERNKGSRSRPFLWGIRSSLLSLLHEHSSWKKNGYLWRSWTKYRNWRCYVDSF